jgi:hypothetical protein
LPKILRRAGIVSYESTASKAGKFDVVFDNNVRKLEEIQPVVQGIKAQLNLTQLPAAAAPILRQAKGGCEQFIMMSSAGVYGPTESRYKVWCTVRCTPFYTMFA